MFNLVSKFFSWVLTPIISALDFPAVPAELAQIVDQVFDYMKAGMGIINFFCPLNLVAPALVVFLAVFAAYHVYSVTLWVLKKIPVLGIE